MVILHDTTTPMSSGCALCAHPICHPLRPLALASSAGEGQLGRNQTNNAPPTNASIPTTAPNVRLVKQNASGERRFRLSSSDRKTLK